VSGGFIEVGCAARWSVAKLDNSVFWLSRNEFGQGQLVRADAGYQPKIVSTRAIERIWDGYSTIDDAEAIAYQMGGYSWYQITFPTAGKTWVFDVSNSTPSEPMWHEREFYNAGHPTRDLACTHAFFEGTHVVGDYRNGNLYALDWDTYTDNTTTLRRLVRTPYIHGERKRVFHKELELDIQAGVGLAAGQGSDPQVIMRYSDDKGRTWSNERWRTMGKMGEYSKRTRWHMLGSSYERTYEFVISDPVEVAIVSASVEVGVGV
jgi:hypothetical protein